MPTNMSIAFAAALLLLPAMVLAQQDKEPPVKEHWKRQMSHKAAQKGMMESVPAHPKLSFYDVKHYHIDIEVNPDNVYIRGGTTVKARIKDHPLDTFILELIDEMQVDSVFFNGQQQPFTHQDDLIRVVLPHTAQVDESVRVRVHYHGTSVGGGVSTGYNDLWDQHATWSLSESFHAREWFPCKQVLSDKADSARITLTTTQPYVAASNGLLRKTDTLSGNKVRYHWATQYPTAYYLLSFAVADYRQYNFQVSLPSASDSMPVQNFVYDDPRYINRYANEIRRTDNLLQLYSKKLGIYPFHREKYGHALMERGGGMEHQTLTSISDFSFLLVAHELMHQWFGDYVTCGSWQDIWINEGFASYGEYMALEELETQAEADEWMKQAHAYALRKEQGSVYVPFEEMMNEQRIFDFALSYKKGAALVHMIRYLMDDDQLFYKALRTFLDQYSHDVATGDDLLEVLNRVSQKDFSSFFEQWYYGEGYPIYQLDWSQETDSLVVQLNQTTSSEEPALFTTPVELGVISKDETDTVLRVKPRSRRHRQAFYYPRQTSRVVIDPDNRILNDTGNVTRVPAISPSHQMEVYPNPVKTWLRVKTPDGRPKAHKTLFIRDMKGKVVLSRDFHQNQVQVNTQGLVSGVYIIEVRYPGHHLRRKFVKW